MNHSHTDQHMGEQPFGRSCVALRQKMNLTQRELAKLLAVSEQTVQRWEHALHVPTHEHLKQLLVLALQRHVFPAERTREAAEQFWLGVGQQADFEVFWMQVQLAAPSAPPAVIILKQEVVQTREPRASQDSPAQSRFDWGEALQVHALYGREQELVQLTHWVELDQCQVVSMLGMGGIGKSALAVTLMRQIAPAFQAVVFRSVRDAPPCQDLLADCLHVFSPQPLPSLPSSVDQCIDMLLECFQTQPCLLVLDNLETLLQEQDAAGHMRPGYEDYAMLLRRVAQTPHQSCLLLTSRELPAALEHLERSRTDVRTLRLEGLALDACEQLLDERELVGTAQERESLAQRYVGNPLALKIVAETISELFGGEIGFFLKQDLVIFSSLRDLLAEQWTRLSVLEQALLIWLAIVREPLGAVELHELLVAEAAEVTEGLVREALEALHRRSLVEHGKQPATFTLQSVVLEYVTGELVERVSQQIQHGVLEDLISYALEQAGAKEYVRQAQERLIVTPILVRLQALPQQVDALEKQLLRLLNQLQTWDQEAQGYGPANLIALLRLQRGHLRSLDLSQLSIRGAYLQGVEMQDTSLARSTLRDTLFTEGLDATGAVAISSTGQYWAAGSWRGNVRVWREGGRRLYLVWLAHTNNTFTLAFSPDERTLATGSWDGSVKLWDLQSGALLWTGWHIGPIFSVAFAPDGHTLASGGNDALVQLWDVSSGKQVQALPSQGGVIYTVTWSPNGGLLACGCFDGSIRLWQVQESQPATSARRFVGHTRWVHALAFSPDSSQLASGSWDSTVKLWDLADGHELQTLRGHTQRVYGVAWSPDGGTLASSDFDGTIWLWDVAQNRYRLALHGHTAVVYDLAFTPDSLRLLSGSEDSTVRLWDVSTGQCIRTIEGYSTSFYDLAWNPDGRTLASAGSDMQILLWEVTGKTPPRELHGHTWIAGAVTWNPNGRLLASGGWDNSVRLWEPSSGACLRILRDANYADTLFFDVEWSPDGRLLAGGTYMHGLHVWDMTTYTCHWVGCQNPTWIHHVAWSPDGTRLVSCGDDSLSLWDASHGMLLERLQWHQTTMLSAAWSSDGRLLASGGSSRSGGEVLVWDITSEHRDEPIQVLHGLTGAVFAVAWSPHGKVLISGENTGTIRWWDVETGACLSMHEGHNGAVQALTVAPDGHILASCGDDSTIRLWDIESAKLLRTLRRDRPYERLDITGIKGLTEAQKETLYSLGAITTFTDEIPPV